MNEPTLEFDTPSHGTPANMPDISLTSRPEISGPLDWVGMEQVHMPIRLRQGSETMMVPALVSLGVDLKQAQVRGIHMSRLYSRAHDFLASHVVTAESLAELLRELIKSQEGLSAQGSLRVQWEMPVLRKALVSDLSGWRQYPVFLESQISAQGELRSTMGFEVLYSSTCPCSAALARQLVQQSFARAHEGQTQFSREQVLEWLGQEESMSGTPHAQRSVARVQLSACEPEEMPPMLELIDRVERVLGTPVQTAVKRVDEQEFARRNAENLMFCEDAARRIRAVFEADARVGEYSIVVEHQESLHAHNAVAKISRGFSAANPSK